MNCQDDMLKKILHLGLEISQGARDSGAGNAEPLHQLDLTGEAA